ncbi:MAG: peptide-methionine (S)-S-oxide reductase, partial [Cyanobacteriota bacterium]|nr:peptide-methionine (S)-S-oxide reductase [Cyanobacteriota bacterium]
MLSVARGLLSLSLTVLLLALPVQAAPLQEAVLAGGCFWCLEHDLETLPGVVEAISGYSGGTLANPSYKQVSAGGTGHQEAVLVRFDPERI